MREMGHPIILQQNSRPGALASVVRCASIRQKMDFTNTQIKPNTSDYLPCMCIAPRPFRSVNLIIDNSVKARCETRPAKNGANLAPGRLRPAPACGPSKRDKIPLSF